MGHRMGWDSACGQGRAHHESITPRHAHAHAPKGSQSAMQQQPTRQTHGATPCCTARPTTRHHCTCSPAELPRQPRALPFSPTRTRRGPGSDARELCSQSLSRQDVVAGRPQHRRPGFHSTRSSSASQDGAAQKVQLATRGAAPGGLARGAGGGRGRGRLRGGRRRRRRRGRGRGGGRGRRRPAGRGGGGGDG
jgi:hypothetical protein